MNTTWSATLRAKFISWVTTTMVMPRWPRSAIRLQHALDQFRIERAGDLVEQHDLGFHGQGAGDGDALLLAAGEIATADGACARARPTSASRAAAISSACFAFDMRFTLRSARVTLPSAVWSGNRLNCWKTMPTRRRSCSGLYLKMLSPSSRMSPPDGFDETVEAAQQGRLARAGRPDDAGDRAGLDREADVVEHLDVAVGHVEVLDLDAAALVTHWLRDLRARAGVGGVRFGLRAPVVRGDPGLLQFADLLEAARAPRSYACRSRRRWSM